MLARFDEAGSLVDGWTCDGGAAALHHFLGANGISSDAVVGLYHWPEDRLADKWRLLEGGEPTKDDLDSYWDDEHHHWVEFRDEHGHWLIDPNGEIRGEPRIQRSADALNYEERDDRETLQWSPWYAPPEDDAWESGSDGEIVPYEIDDAYERERPAWQALGLG
jgi:hypothetical protein